MPRRGTTGTKGQAKLFGIEVCRLYQISYISQIIGTAAMMANTMEVAKCQLKMMERQSSARVSPAIDASCTPRCGRSGWCTLKMSTEVQTALDEKKIPIVKIIRMGTKKRCPAHRKAISVPIDTMSARISMSISSVRTPAVTPVIQVP